jgi:hypothetical protein
MSYEQGEEIRWYSQVHVQKDGRINLGTCIHIYEDCGKEDQSPRFEIEGPIINHLPKCKKCLGKWTLEHRQR